MATFECSRCGRCCQSFGEFIRIERKLSDRDYYCRYGITDELFFVHVQPEFADEISKDFSVVDGSGSDPFRRGCLFLRKDPEGGTFSCAVYPTRPSICREFRCYLMLIYHIQSGELRGKVIGTGELRTEDKRLAALFQEKISLLPHSVHYYNSPAQPPARSQRRQAAQGHESHIRGHLYGLSRTADKEWVKNVVSILAAHGYRGNPVDD